MRGRLMGAGLTERMSAHDRHHWEVECMVEGEVAGRAMCGSRHCEGWGEAREGGGLRGDVVVVWIGCLDRCVWIGVFG